MKRSFMTAPIIAVLATTTFAQTQAPIHQHYEKKDPPPAASGQLAARLKNVGTSNFTVTTSSPDAQAFFNQGLDLSYAFNHPEAGRAFAEATRLDPSCAMAYWGQALVLGPNINAPMDANDEPKALDLVNKAVSLKDKVTERERDYIDALAARYTGKAEDRAEANKAYLERMKALSKKYPDDLDAAAMSAEAFMDTRPWDYYARDGVPFDGTAEAVASIRSVLARKPDHIGALHLYIHLQEYVDPGSAEIAADRLLPLAPSAGHLVHMPAHIYIRVGRYNDAVKANELAIAADESYITQCRAQGIYPLAYYPHNIHFLWAAANYEGRSQMALDAAHKMAAAIPADQVSTLPFLQLFLVPQYVTAARFGRWDETLKIPAPPKDARFMTGMWHYVRGRAFVGKNQLGDAAKEYKALRQIAEDQALATAPMWSQNNALDILRIARAVLAGELAARKKDYATAVAELDAAVRFHDALVYVEPDDWYYPVRESLGAVLLDAGRAHEAEVVYWEDLRRNPENGWSLYGLGQALRAQKKDSLAAIVDARFAKAWARADVKLSSSRF